MFSHFIHLYIKAYNIRLNKFRYIMIDIHAMMDIICFIILKDEYLFAKM